MKIFDHCAAALWSNGLKTKSSCGCNYEKHRVQSTMTNETRTKSPNIRAQEPNCRYDLLINRAPRTELSLTHTLISRRRQTSTTLTNKMNKPISSSMRSRTSDRIKNSLKYSSCLCLTVIVMSTTLFLAHLGNVSLSNVSQ